MFNWVDSLLSEPGTVIRKYARVYLKITVVLFFLNSIIAIICGIIAINNESDGLGLLIMIAGPIVAFLFLLLEILPMVRLFAFGKLSDDVNSLNAKVGILMQRVPATQVSYINPGNVHSVGPNRSTGTPDDQIKTAVMEPKDVQNGASKASTKANIKKSDTDEIKPKKDIGQKPAEPVPDSNCVYCEKCGANLTDMGYTSTDFEEGFNCPACNSFIKNIVK